MRRERHHKGKWEGKKRLRSNATAATYEVECRHHIFSHRFPSGMARVWLYSSQLLNFQSVASCIHHGLAYLRRTVRVHPYKASEASASSPSPASAISAAPIKPEPTSRATLGKALRFDFRSKKSVSRCSEKTEKKSQLETGRGNRQIKLERTKLNMAIAATVATSLAKSQTAKELYPTPNEQTAYLLSKFRKVARHLDCSLDAASKPHGHPFLPSF